MHPHDAEERGIVEGDWWASRAARAIRCWARQGHRASPARGRVHHVPFSGIGCNVITTDNSDWATNCPEYKVTAVQATRVTQPSEWQKKYTRFSKVQHELLGKARQASGAAKTIA